MKKVAFIIDKPFRQNILFDRNQKKRCIRDNVFHKYYTLYDEFYKHGYEICTHDINSIKNSDIVIYKDIPNKLPNGIDIYKSYVILMESPLASPLNLDKSTHIFFKKIFTWDDELVDNVKYFKINYAFNIPSKVKRGYGKKKLCCLIVANKESNYPGELYSERKKIIRWFESTNPSDFDLYGVGWNEYHFKGVRLVRALNRIPVAKKIMYKYFGDYYPSYRGAVGNKIDVMQRYKFAICYENIINISGYITEKMLDAFFAGCVPVYLGADNVEQHIPKECFVDRRDFKSNEELYDYLKTVNDSEHQKYINKIEDFLSSDKEKNSVVIVFQKL